MTAIAGRAPRACASGLTAPPARVLVGGRTPSDAAAAALVHDADGVAVGIVVEPVRTARRAGASVGRSAGVVLVGGRVRSGAPGVDLGAAALLRVARLLGRRTAVVGLEPELAGSFVSRLRVRALVRCADVLVVRTRADADRLVAAGARPPFRVGSDEEGLRLARLLFRGGEGADLAHLDGLRLHPPVEPA